MAKHISHQSMTVARTAHYSTFGSLNKKTTKYIWIVMHDYGQIASRLINKFDKLDPEEHFVIAVEGLNRFYWTGEERVPVACWMTSRDRYDEINDFTRYLDQIYQRYVSHVNQDTVEVILMGFSQGCATMWRWIHASQPHYDIAINWAGWIPEDISYRHLEEYLDDKQHHLWYGDEDHFITDEALGDIKKVIDDNNLSLRIEKFKGGHKIVRSEFQRFVDTYILTDS